MKHILTFLAAIMLATLGINANAQKNKTDDNYNLKKAMEAINEDDSAKALELLNLQLRQTPDNVEALILRLSLFLANDDYAQALADVNHALRVNKPKKTDVPNAILYWWKGTAYQSMYDVPNALACFRTAYDLSSKEKLDAEDYYDVAFDYAHMLYVAGDYVGADTVYKRQLAIDETNQAAMVGLARNMIERGQYKDAVDLLNRCQALDDSYTGAYPYKMKAYKRMGEPLKAIDAGLDWYEKGDNPQYDSIVEVLKLKPNYADVSMKGRAKRSGDPMEWAALQSEFYEQTHKYAEAVKIFDAYEAKVGKTNAVNRRRSRCYSELGLYKQAIEDISKILEDDSGVLDLCRRGDYYRLSGDLDAAIADFSAAIEEAPDFHYPYYKRGWCYEMQGNAKKAMDDYNLGIEISPDYAYLYLMRGELLLSDGRKGEADEDFAKIIQIDTVATSGSCRHYALHFLGRDKEAEQWMKQIIEKDPDDSGEYYNLSCLYSRMGRPEDAIAALKTAFEKGYRSFAHLVADDDMDPIRDLPAYKALVDEYKAKHEAYLKENEMEVPVYTGEGKESEIAIRRQPGGTFEIPCEINGLPLQMIFDTGASDVTISSLEANFMLKNGYLSAKDIRGKKYYQVANGQISEGTVITLREVKVGDAVLRDVDASVVNSQRAPLLLGQSVMERFGTITIDNQNNKLIIRH